jgi:hypothetical protein
MMCQDSPVTGLRQLCKQWQIDTVNTTTGGGCLLKKILVNDQACLVTLSACLMSALHSVLPDLFSKHHGQSG